MNTIRKSFISEVQTLFNFHTNLDSVLVEQSSESRDVWCHAVVISACAFTSASLYVEGCSLRITLSSHIRSWRNYSTCVSFPGGELITVAMFSGWYDGALFRKQWHSEEPAPGDLRLFCFHLRPAEQVLQATALVKNSPRPNSVLPVELIDREDEPMVYWWTDRLCFQLGILVDADYTSQRKQFLSRSDIYKYLLPGVRASYAFSLYFWDSCMYKATEAEYLLASKGAVRWERAFGGAVPACALPTGFTLRGEPIYSARVRKTTNLCVGNLFPNDTGCRVMTGTASESIFSDYEVLCLTTPKIKMKVEEGLIVLARNMPEMQSDLDTDSPSSSSSKKMRMHVQHKKHTLKLRQLADKAAFPCKPAASVSSRLFDDVPRILAETLPRVLNSRQRNDRTGVHLECVRCITTARLRMSLNEVVVKETSAEENEALRPDDVKQDDSEDDESAALYEPAFLRYVSRETPHSLDLDWVPPLHNRPIQMGNASTSAAAGASAAKVMLNDEQEDSTSMEIVSDDSENSIPRNHRSAANVPREVNRFHVNTFRFPTIRYKFWDPEASTSAVHVRTASDPSDQSSSDSSESSGSSISTSYEDEINFDHMPAPPKPFAMPQWVDEDGYTLGERVIAGVLVQGGLSADGTPTYVSRFSFDGHLLPDGHDRADRTSFFGPMFFEVLMVPKGCPLFPEWVPARDGDVPANAFPAGYSKDGEMAYVARACHKGYLLSGRVLPSEGGCMARECCQMEMVLCKEYEVLTFQ